MPESPGVPERGAGMFSVSKMALTLSMIALLAVFSQALALDGTGDLEHITQELVPPPFLPKHEQVARGKPKVVRVRMVIEEKQMDIGYGATVWAMTYNGTVPGPLIVVHQDDYVELALVNPESNTLLHNIDFHAATGALGGGDLTKVNPGEEVVLRFRATRPGVFIYHCAPGGLMVPWHVVSGMNGAIMVLPREGLKDEKGNPIRYDRAYYIGEQDFYMPRDDQGTYRKYHSPVEGMKDMLDVMKTLTPTHMVFNGSVGSLTGDRALKAKVGERVLFIHSQANRDTRPHLIGGHADLFWQGGSFNDTPLTNLETWFVPGGSAVAALYRFQQPGTYVYVNHNLIEAFQFGALAEIKVDGAWDDGLMKQVKKPARIQE